MQRLERRPTCSTPSGGQISHLVPAVLLEVVALHTADGFWCLTAHHDHHLHTGTVEGSKSSAEQQCSECSGSFSGYFGDADWGSWSRPVGLDEVSLVRWQQVILQGFYEEVFAGVVVLDQGLFLHNLKTIRSAKSILRNAVVQSV